MSRVSAAIFDKSLPNSPLSVPASETAVLLMDYQNLIIGAVGEAGQPCVTKAKEIRDWACAKGMLVIHCLIDLDLPIPTKFKGRERIQGMLTYAKQNPGLEKEDSSLAAVQDTTNETTVHRVPGLISALKSEGILEKLKARGIKSLVLGGLSTSGCVLRTTCAASDEDYIVTVLEDACADPVKELHDLLVQHTLPSQAHVTTFAQFQKEWE